MTTFLWVPRKFSDRYSHSEDGDMGLQMLIHLYQTT